MKRNLNAFTLVELIVVITILAILATIGFVSFSGYLAGSRDTNRVAQMKAMSDTLALYSTKKDLPLPDDDITIVDGAGTIAYQGYIGKNVLETIEYTEAGLDPRDKVYFSYYLTADKKYYQLLGHLEEEQDTTAFNGNNDLFDGALALDYSSRIVHLQGKQLGILTSTGTFEPVHEIVTTSLNIGTTTTDYIAHFDDGSNLTSDNTNLQYLRNVANAGGVAGSCETLLNRRDSLKGKSGTYLISSSTGAISTASCTF